MIGSACITTATFAVSLAVMYAVNAMGILRVSEEGEMFGLDLHEHGISAYPEYVLSSLGAPSGMPKDTVLPAPTALMGRTAVSHGD
jgi:Amt family ammonium transporter